MSKIGVLGLERHGGRVPAGLWARIVQRLLALNARIWHNWLIGAPVRGSCLRLGAAGADVILDKTGLTHHKPGLPTAMASAPR